MRKVFVLFTAALMMMGCGEQYQAKGVVKDFLKSNLTTTDYSVKRFSSVDSTRNITPQQVAGLRHLCTQLKAFKKAIDYPAYEKKDALKFTRMTLMVNDDTLNCTFYLDKSLQRVVAFKSY